MASSLTANSKWTKCIKWMEIRLRHFRKKRKMWVVPNVELAPRMSSFWHATTTCVSSVPPRTSTINKPNSRIPSQRSSANSAPEQQSSTRKAPQSCLKFTTRWSKRPKVQSIGPWWTQQIPWGETSKVWIRIIKTEETPTDQSTISFHQTSPHKQTQSEMYINLYISKTNKMKLKIVKNIPRRLCSISASSVHARPSAPNVWFMVRTKDTTCAFWKRRTPNWSKSWKNSRLRSTQNWTKSSFRSRLWSQEREKLVSRDMPRNSTCLMPLTNWDNELIKKSGNWCNSAIPPGKVWIQSWNNRPEFSKDSKQIWLT